jgi:hypothetical protein
VPALVAKVRKLESLLDENCDRTALHVQARNHYSDRVESLEREVSRLSNAADLIAAERNAAVRDRDALRAEVDELKRTAVASQTGDMLKIMFNTLLNTSADNPAKNYAACHIEWDDGVWAGLNLPFQRIQFALIRPGAQSPTEKLAMTEARAVVAEREVERLRGAMRDEQDEATLEADGLRALLKRALPHVHANAEDLDSWNNHVEAAEAQVVASAIEARIGLAADGSSSGGKAGG